MIDMDVDFLPGSAKTGQKPKLPPADSPRRPGVLLIRDAFVPACLLSASGELPAEFDTKAFKSYRDALLREGGSRDVLEQCLLEQVAAGHLAALNLLSRCGRAQTPEAAGIYAVAAVKLMGESRRSIATIKGMRSPAPPANITIAATQQVNIAGKPEAEPDQTPEKTHAHTELGSNNEPGSDRMRQIFGEGAGRAPEPAIAGTAD